MENKPFVFGVATSGDNFTDRKKETARLLSNFRHGVNTVLISPRRWGKTSLVRKVCRLAQSDTLKVVYLDIFSCRSEREFYDAFASAVLKQTSSKLEEWMENARLFLSRISPKISLGTEPMTDFSISLELNPKADDVDDILQLPEKIAQKKGIDVVVCIDEFQQITEYPEQNMEALLRTYIQQLKNIRFIFSGSQRAMMLEIFSNANRPFFASTQYLAIEKIQQDVYATFITDLFERYGKQIDPNCVAEILNWSRRHTFYTQSLCNRIFAMGTSHVTTEQVKWACSDLLERNEPVFLQYRQLLTPIQWNFLIAIAKEHEVKQISAQHLISKYGIGSPANARRLAKAMIEKELVLETVDKTGVTYQVYDVFFSRWLEREY